MPSAGVTLGVIAAGIVLAGVSRDAPTGGRALTSGLCEVAGFALFVVGARHGIAVSAVLASQFAAISALGAYVLFRERLARVQLAGVAAVVAGVAVLTALQEVVPI